jgi:stage V sporulation protein K
VVGKTIVARLFGNILHEIGMRKTANVVETTGQELVQNGAIKADVTIQSAMDGVLFIDEAHSLDPKSNRGVGWAIINRLLKAASDQRDRITIILAG